MLAAYGRRIPELLGFCGVLVALAAAGCSGRVVQRAAFDARPNVLLVTLDTTRADRLGCYGNPAAITPNFDTLAKEAVTFETAFAQSSLTPVSHASILTGMNPYRHGLRVLYAGSNYHLPTDVPMLSVILHEAGWKTAAFLSSFAVSEFYGLDRGFDVFDSGVRGKAEMLPTADGVWKWDVTVNQRASQDTTERAIAYVKNVDGPFFLWVHYWDPHDDVLVPPQDVLARFGVLDGQGKERLVALYDAEVFFVDRQFGRLREALEESDRYRNTLVVVVSDHGEGLGDHGWWFHRLLYQEQIRVPLIVRLPGGPAGLRVPQLVRTIDIVPTLLEIAHVAAPAPVEGASLLGLIDGRPEKPRVAYADSLNAYDLSTRLTRSRPLDDVLYCAVEYPWKLIYRPRRPAASELYDLGKDPRESVNILAQEATRAQRLKSILEGLGALVERPVETGSPSSEAIERLRSLGYVGDGPAGTSPLDGR